MIPGVTKYRNFRIFYEPPPIPLRLLDWTWVHEDYDGAPDSGDDRHGCAPSEAAAMADVDEWWEEQSIMNPEHEQTWRDLVADVAEQKRRAELFPELVATLDRVVMSAHPTYRTTAETDAIALLIRCRKPQP